MNCKRAKTEIALWVGDDLDELAERSLRRHLAACPCCRDYCQRLKSSLQILHDPGHKNGDSIQDSVWPDLADRLPSRQQLLRRNRFNGWVPGMAIVAATIVIVASTLNRPVVEYQDNRPLMTPTPASTTGIPLGGSGDLWDVFPSDGFLNRLQERNRFLRQLDAEVPGLRELRLDPRWEDDGSRSRPGRR